MNEIIHELQKKNPKCYEYFETNIIPKLEEPIEPKHYEFTSTIISKKNIKLIDKQLLNSLFFDVIKILWQKKESQKEIIVIVFSLFCNDSNFDNMIEQQQKGGNYLIYSIIFSLIILTNYIVASYKINLSNREPPPRQPRHLPYSTPHYLTTTTTRDMQLPQEYLPQNLHEITDILENIKEIISNKLLKQSVSYLQSKTGKKFGVKIFGKINSVFKLTNTNEDIEKRLINVLKIIDLDTNKLILDVGITISLGLSEFIGFSELLSEIISIGLLPEVKFASIAAPIFLDSLIGNTFSLEPDILTDHAAQQRFIQLISIGGKSKKTNKRMKKMKRMKTMKNNKKTYNKRST
uniref:Uncharacterized protein n=1 Tax=viral metagenome TaxID=1070528 RepID=A0A6C0HZZ4_9ZZZZ